MHNRSIIIVFFPDFYILLFIISIAILYLRTSHYKFKYIQMHKKEQLVYSNPPTEKSLGLRAPANSSEGQCVAVRSMRWLQIHLSANLQKQMLYFIIRANKRMHIEQSIDVNIFVPFV